MRAFYVERPRELRRAATRPKNNLGGDLCRPFAQLELASGALISKIGLQGGRAVRKNRNKIFCSLNRCRILGLALQVSFLLIGSSIADTSVENQNATPDWHVLCLKGDWHYFYTAMDPKSKPITRSNRNVPGGVLVRLLNTLSNDEYIVISYGNDPNVLINKDCSNWNDCSRPIFLPKLLNDPHKTNWVEEAVLYLKTMDETVASIHRMRGMPRREEGVALIVDDNPQLDLTDVKGFMKKGSYSLTSVNKGSAINELNFSWDPTTSVVKLEGPKLLPGLYEISPLEDQGTSIRILLCTGTQCSQAKVRFHKVQSSIKKCQEDDEYHDYLRTYLVYLLQTKISPKQ